jgi:hypothetical protein
VKSGQIDQEMSLKDVWKLVTDHRVRVTFNGIVSAGTVQQIDSWFKNGFALLTERYMLEIRLDKKVHDGEFMDGHGVSMGIYSDDLQVITEE